MEIDPRLRPVGEGHSHSQAHRHGHRSDTRHPVTHTNTTTAYVPSPATASASSDTATHDYPDPPGRSLSFYAALEYQRQHPPRTNTTNTLSPNINTNTNINEIPDPNDPYYSDVKRPRACEACRQLKVRCEPDTNPNNTQSCKRCAKTGRQCVVTAPTRKRQRKTDSRVAELERKIDTLTASLVAGKGPERGGHGHGHGQVPPQPGVGTGLRAGADASAGAGPGIGRRWLGAKNVSASGSPTVGVKRDYSGEVKEREEKAPGPGPTLPVLYPSRPVSPSQKQWRGPWSGPSAFGTGQEAGSGGGDGFVDVIDKGLVSLEAASEAFEFYVNEMALQLPIVTFPPGTQMHEIRRSKPILFHNIVAVSIGPIQPDIQVTLFDDFWKILAERMVVKGQKSLELVQAMLLATTWYLPPDHYEELKFYQLIHMAITLAIDIGMFRRTKTTKKPFNIMRDLVGKKAFSLDLDSPEIRRTWLGCYYLAVQVAAALRRVPLIRWHPYMDECIEILETSPDALPSDKALIQWTKLAQITEEVGVHFSFDEPDSNATFSEPKVQYTLRVLEKQLEQWRKETPVELYSLTMQQTDYLLNTYIHEPTMHIDSTTDQKLRDTDHPSPTSAAYITALSTCLTCVHQSLDIITSMDTRNLICLPTYVLARASYAIVALIRIYAIVSGPETQIGQVIEPSSLKVESYLDRVVEHYKVAGEHPGGRTPGKFAVILDLLRIWFLKQKDQNPELKEALAGTGSGGGERSHCEGLNLLSEVAMGKPKSQSRPGSNQTFRSGYGAGTDRSESMHPASIDSLVSQPLSGPGTTNPDPQQQQQTWIQYPQYQSSYHADTSTSYPDPNAATTAATSTANANSNQAFIPELAVQVGAGLESENLFTWGNMLGDGFFNFPFAVDGNTGFW